MKRAGGAAARSALLPARAFRWRGVELEVYRDLAGTAAAAVSRQVLVAGSAGAPIGFDVRYFELTPGGRTNFEQHQHAHVVIGLRGAGRVRLGRRWVRLRGLDACYVAPGTPHELHNDRRNPFGFLCIVDAERDRGRPVPGRGAPTESRRRQPAAASAPRRASMRRRTGTARRGRRGA
jgi:S-methyl-1-thioxylulose 5-phosphate methylthiotransferase